MLSGHVFSPVLSFARRSAIDRIVFFGTPEEMAGSDDKYLRDFLGGT